MDLDTLINSGCLSLDFIEGKYALYQQDPQSVDPSWRAIFEQLDSKGESLSSVTLPDLAEQPVLTPGQTNVLYYPRLEISSGTSDLRIFNLLDAYRTYGHLYANVNPLDSQAKREFNELALENFGFTKQDLSLPFPSCGLFKEESAPLLDIINALKAIYCDKIGVEYMGLQNPELEHWLQQQIEPTRFKSNLSIEQKQMILNLLNKSELFESFIHMKYVGQKRFSLEGGETLVPMLAALTDTGAGLGIDEYVLGMAHRGRLNVLANIFDKSYADIFSEFEEGYVSASVEGSGDVKYHKGFYSEVKTVHGVKIKLSLTPNPSHLEAVDPVVEGQVKARQVMRGDDIRKEKVLPILIHGDAAIAGQGIVYETLQFSQLEGYSTGGTIHLVVNNQIGFTTIPSSSRSTRYCTDIARAFGAPVFHVNAEDPEGCVFATNLAVKLRQKFHCDVFIDLNCYRKYGHNETDEPSFTQPLEYQVIRKKHPIREIYRDTLIHQGVLEQHMAETLEVEFKASLHEAQSKKLPPKGQDHQEEISPAAKNDGFFQPIQTGVSVQLLQEVGQRICTFPPGLTIHPKLAILNKERLMMLKNDPSAHPLDWGMAELLAYGSLLWNGTHVRLSGQDSCRGTFSHRHAMLMDQVKEQGYIPLQHLKDRQGRFDVYNSPLSEYAILGFEFGYSIANPDALVIWEAQFGDFANGAQIIIDQFISTAEQKWGQKFPLTLFLPHGYEGQGPEHSSGRIERFLTLAGDHNMQIVNPTTPAQFFHLLRRQVLRPLHKPLVVFTPKGLLRHPACKSSIEDLSHGHFQEVLDDPTPPKRPLKLILCSGKIFYDLHAERERLDKDDLAIVRIEQLYPLNIESVKALFSRWTSIKECIWVQEEPSNMGAWTFIRQILRDVLPKGIELGYIGRTRSASPASGSLAAHKKEHAAIMSQVFSKEQPSLFDIVGNFKV